MQTWNLKLKSFIEKTKQLQKLLSMQKSCPLQLKSGLLKVSCNQINYRPKTIRDDCCMIVQLSSDAIVRLDYCPNPTDYYSKMTNIMEFKKFQSLAEYIKSD